MLDGDCCELDLSSPRRREIRGSVFGLGIESNVAWECGWEGVDVESLWVSIEWGGIEWTSG